MPGAVRFRPDSFARERSGETCLGTLDAQPLSPQQFQPCTTRVIAGRYLKRNPDCWFKPLRRISIRAATPGQLSIHRAEMLTEFGE
jgi:hypothetical protein